VPGRILEVRASTAVVVIDLVDAFAPRIGPMLLSTLQYAAVDGVEVGLVDQEGVMLGVDLLIGRAPCSSLTARKGPNSRAGGRPKTSVK
jgi:hypothetical protein